MYKYNMSKYKKTLNRLIEDTYVSLIHSDRVGYIDVLLDIVYKTILGMDQLWLSEAGEGAKSFVA